ncbi:MAG TPA: TfoX/Sxy family protein [Candidatus Saccharimonadales bacterium]|nr:TfoX/Sxy family protein [Candidatus Saccharimonadales bacterium]
MPSSDGPSDGGQRRDMPERGSMHWERSSPELTARFEATTAAMPGLTRRKMFGEAAAFVNGNMVTGLHAGRWFVRLTGQAKAEALALPGAGPFEPIPGRPMGDYVVLPATFVGDDAALARWLERAIEVGRALKPK